MAKIKVYAKTEIALHARMAHPIDGVMRANGSYWEDDTFTYRRLRDGDITSDASQAWQAVAPAPPAEIALANPPVKKPKLNAV